MNTQILKATLLIFIIFFSCNQANLQRPILEQAEKVMSEHPDSALSLLEHITTPEEMPECDYATWCLLITEARDKNYIEHTSDSLINVAIQYFEKKKNINRLAKAYYCQGRVLSDLNTSEEALIAYFTVYMMDQDYKKACIYNERYLLLRDSIEQIYQPQTGSNHPYPTEAC